jgi:hypothetical protein
MIPLGMVMLDVFAQHSPHGALTKKNDLRQTLIAQNVKRIRLQHNMSMASLATDSGLPEAWVTRMERGLENCTVDQLAAP